MNVFELSDAVGRNAVHSIAYTQDGVVSGRINVVVVELGLKMGLFERANHTRLAKCQVNLNSDFLKALDQLN